jgi:hypothetical protein
MPYANPEEKRNRNRLYYVANREKLLAAQREYALANPEKVRAAQKEYRAANRESRREYFRGYSRIYNVIHRKEKQAYVNQRLKSDPEARVTHNLRVRVRHAMKRSGARKSAATRELIGCTIPELRAHLESQFRPGMTWENYGPVWHIDHRRPCASFDLLDPAQQRVCFHYTNLQPLFAEENLKKGAK